MRAAIDDIDELLDVLRSPAAAEDDGEAVAILQHLLQCGALLRDRCPGDEELHVAGLVHDIGTVLEPDQPATHAANGAATIRSLLGERVAMLVADHDLAKRYLMATDPGYRSRLTPRSIETLAAQGGPLDERARVAFESSPTFDACVALRRADDDAKDRDRSVPDLESWRPTIAAVARRAREGD